MWNCTESILRFNCRFYVTIISTFSLLLTEFVCLSRIWITPFTLISPLTQHFLRSFPHYVFFFVFFFSATDGWTVPWLDINDVTEYHWFSWGSWTSCTISLFWAKLSITTSDLSSSLRLNSMQNSNVLFSLLFLFLYMQMASLLWS